MFVLGKCTQKSLIKTAPLSVELFFFAPYLLLSILFFSIAEYLNPKQYGTSLKKSN